MLLLNPFGWKGILLLTKMRKYYLFYSLFLILAAACNTIDEQDQGGSPKEIQLTFKATHESGKPSKTTLVSDGEMVWWTPGDEVNVFFGGSRGTKFSTAISEAKPTVDFTGVVSIDDAEYNDYVLAVYPYSEDQTSDKTTVTLSLSRTQTAVPESVADKFLPTMARTRDNTLTFFNVCGGIEFSLTQSGITEIRFRGNNGEILAGKARVGFGNAGVPEVVEVVDGSATELILKPSDGGAFIAGKKYYIAAFPCALEKGFEIEFFRDGDIARIHRDTPVQIKRSVWGCLSGIDAGLVFGSRLAPADELWYTTESGDIATPYMTDGLPEILSNTYSNGKGVIKFASDYTALPKGFFYNNELVNSVILGHTVKTIGRLAFAYCYGLETILFPDTIEEIGYGAFAYSGLKALSINTSNNIVVRESAFYACQELNDVSINFSEGCGSVTLESHAFSTCENLEEVYVGTIVSIDSEERFEGYNPFERCKQLSAFHGPSASKDNRILVDGSKVVSFAPAGLTEFTVPSGITVIGKAAFRGSSLSRIVLPEGLKEMQEDCFENNLYLETLSLPSTLERLGFRCLSQTPLSTIALPFGLKYIERLTFAQCPLTTVQIPSGMVNIEDCAFNYCHQLESFSGKWASDDGRCLIIDGFLVAFAEAGLNEYIVQEGVTTIGGTFASTHLETLTLPSTLTDIAGHLKWGDLKSINFHSLAPPTILEDTFDENEAILYVPAGSLDAYKAAWTKYESRIQPIPEVNRPAPADELWYTTTDGNIITPVATSGLPQILSNTYTGELGIIKFASDYITIPANFMQGNTALKSVAVGEAVLEIGEMAFKNASSLESFVFPKGFSINIGQGAFIGTALKDVHIQSGVINIMARAFEYLPITSLRLDATGETSPDVPYSTVYIEDFAFTGCQNLDEVIIIPSAEGNYGGIWMDGAFTDCPSLKTVTLGKLNSCGPLTFDGCTSLTRFIGPNATSDGRCLVLDSTLVAFAESGLTSYSIPAGITTIGRSAFYNKNGLESVVFNDGIETIRHGAFSECRNLKSISLPTSLKTIESASFVNTGLVTVNIPDGIENIYEDAFYGNSLQSFTGKWASDDGRAIIVDGCLKCFAPSGLTSYSVPEGVTSVGYTFDGQLPLKELSFPGTLTKLGAFSIFDLEAVYFHSLMPPTLENELYYNKELKIYVPQASVNLYKDAWPGCASIITSFPVSGASESFSKELW